ncbi:CHAT domain-containing tetratricopeptide repeat protein [Nostoc sp. ChiQUE01b]|uniref:CHAT domain-containing protein n=1 Tax=Nostoc sp. ChiQUE01b TaxID=3075376 RepID=UPI002AD31B9A|nr:CHAT domain-containing tetratricopeptide repeat protein [Nostoc sp. ChiQUE01b]MDZ8263959.1 CHAT domain-containing tetratricopeptide repeat protein [Nostoc sp. ChiQUE01b]
MRLRTFILFSLLTAAFTGLLFYYFQNKLVYGQKKSGQFPNTNLSITPPNLPKTPSICIIENIGQDKSPNLINSEKLTLEQADRLLLEGTQSTEAYKYDNALRSFETALKVYQKEKDFEKQAITLGRIGNVYYQTADYKKAINCHNKRKTIADIKIINKKEEVAALSSLGNAYYAMGNYSKARIYYSRSLKFAQDKNILMDQDNRKRAEAIALAGLGSVAHSIGNYTKAIKLHEDRLNIVDEALNNNQNLTEENQKEFIKLKASVLGSLGNAYHNQGNYTKAIEYYEAHLKTAINAKNKREEAIALGELGSASHSSWVRNNFIRKDDLEQAIKYYKDRLSIAEEIGDRRLVASTYGGLGNIYYSTGNLEKANLEKSHKDYNEVIKYTNNYLSTSTDIEDRPGMGNALNILGVTYFQISNILKNQEKTLKETGRITEAEQKFAEAQENLDKAIKSLKEAISVREYLRKRLTETEKILIFDTQQTAYLNLQQVYVSKGEYDLALEIAETGRAKAFVDVLAKQLNMNREISPNFKIQDIKRIAQEQQATLVIYSNILEKDSITNDSEKFYIWVVRPNQEKVSFEQVDLKSTKIWKESLSKIRQRLQNLGGNDRPVGILVGSIPRAYIRGTKKDISSGNEPYKKDIEELLAANYELLIKPNNQNILSIEDKKVIFIPQGSLFEIPFAALYDIKEKQYLIEKHTILTSPSVQVLDMLHKRQQKRELHNKPLQNKDWLILGLENAKPNKFCSQDVTLNKLPGAEQEAKDIAYVLFQGKAIEDKTETAVRKKMLQARMIHLATHGLLDNCKEDAEVPGAIALDASENDDGWLTASEISQMELQAELIVLSACDTALGKLTGDGVIGLSRSALAAGSSSAIVSLWKVEDYSTAFLMKEFYTQLKEQQSKLGKLDKAEALRQAMLKTKNYVDKNTKKKIYSEPYQWSAFTLVGEPTTQLEKR